jgi:hypothetical protein
VLEPVEEPFDDIAVLVVLGVVGDWSASGTAATFAVSGPVRPLWDDGLDLA